MPSARDDLAKRFVDEIRLRALDDHYIDRKEEREILQLAIADGVNAETARTELAKVCAESNYVLESDVLEKAKTQLDGLSQSGGGIDKKEFQTALARVMKETQGRKKEIEVKRLLAEIIKDNNYRIVQGWFSNWFTRLKQEVGLG